MTNNMEQPPKFETPEMPFEDLRNDIETSQAQLKDLVREGQESQEETLNSFAEQIKLMQRLGVPEDLVEVFNHDLTDLRNEGKSWSARLADFKDKLVGKVLEWVTLKQKS
jgi:hypothetical protein